MNEKLLRAIDKKLALEGVEAAVIEGLLGLDINPQRRTYEEIDGSFAGLSLPILTSNIESILASFQQLEPMMLIQTRLSNGEYRVERVELSNQDMDKICALWIRYKVEM